MVLTRRVFGVLLLFFVFCHGLEAASQRARIQTSLNSMQGKLRSLGETQEEVRDHLADLQAGVRALKETQEGVQGHLAGLKADVRALNTLMTDSMPEDCWAAKARGSRRRIVRVNPPGLAPRKVACDQKTEGGGWTVVLERYPTRDNHSERESFNRTWNQYKEGFGQLHEEFWIGNEVLHALTSHDPHQLYVSLEDWKGKVAVGIWNYFKVADESKSFRLSVGEYQEGRSTTGDSFYHHHHHAFSTYDHDNDSDDHDHCARSYGGGWWYFSCHMSHLTGAAVPQGEGGHHAITWRTWPPSRTIGLKSATMMIRPLPPTVVMLDNAAICPASRRP